MLEEAETRFCLTVKTEVLGTSLAVQWLGFSLSTAAGDPCWIPGQRTKTLQEIWSDLKVKKKIRMPSKSSLKVTFDLPKVTQLRAELT